MITNKGRYFIIFLAVVLIVYEIIELDFSTNFKFKSLAGLVTPLLLIIAMILSIRHVNNHGEN